MFAWAPLVLKLCDRARICPSHVWWGEGVLRGDHLLGSRQKKHVMA
jgi:hypothetical protein